MKILFLISSLKNGGAERVVVNLANSFSQKKYKVSIAVFDNVESDYEVFHKVSIKAYQVKNQNKVATLFSGIRCAEQAIRDFEPNIVVSFLSTVNIYSLLGNLTLKKPIIVSERNDPNSDPEKWYYRILRKLTYHLSDGFVFQTKEAKMYFSKSIQKRSAVIPNPVFVDEKYIKKNYSGKINYIVSVGRLEKQKNYKMLIDAFAEIVSDIDNCRLTIYGEGSIRGELERYINEKGLIDKVLLPGRINNIHEKLMESDLFVLSSDYEGMSNALMEAMAIGLPCISTDCPIGGSAELIENHKNGLLVPVGDKDKLKEAIRHLVSNNNLASEMGENAKFIRKSNSLQQISDMWEGYLLDVVETRGNLK